MSVRFNTIDVDGLKVFYREAGGKHRPTILLLHGFPTASHMFRDLIPQLSDDFHVIAPDFPGFGMTGKRSEAAYAHVWKIEDGRIADFRQYIETKAVADARS